MARYTFTLLGAVLITMTGLVFGAEKADQIVEHNMLMNHGGGHLMDMDGGMVMGMNKDTLPPGCARISEDASITVRAGHKYTKDFPGTMFGLDQHEWRVKPCTRLTVTFINEDHIRHQWMMHGLPKFIYDKGMFHLEMTGPAKITGTLILPAEDKTYLVHCDIAQHMEKGMKGQLIVGNGSTPFPSIPGLTDFAIPDDYGPKVADSIKVALPAGSAPGAALSSVNPTKSGGSNGTFLLGLILGAIGTPFAITYYRRRFEGMTQDEVIQHLLTSSKSIFDKILGLLMTLVSKVTKK
ncbi:MAG: copper oxidase [Methylococcus sp.]